MEILVTGSKGFIGRHIATALTWDGHEVIDYNRNDHFPRRNVDLIVHCAAAAGPWHTLDDIWRDNLDLTRNLIKYSVDNYVPIIFMSSIMVYGDLDENVVSESTPIYSGASYYAQSKRVCEVYLKMSGVSYVALRLPGVIGPDANLRNWLPATARDLLTKGETTVYGPKHNFNNVVHTRDLCNFVCHLVKQDFDQETFCLASEGMLTVEKTVHHLANCLHVIHPTINTTPAVKQQFVIDYTHAVRHGYGPMTTPQAVALFAKELLEIRAQQELDFKQ